MLFLSAVGIRQSGVACMGFGALVATKNVELDVLVEQSTGGTGITGYVHAS